jgi:hypothetical protein
VFNLSAAFTFITSGSSFEPLLISSKTMSSGCSLRTVYDIFEPINSSLSLVVCLSSQKTLKFPLCGLLAAAFYAGLLHHRRRWSPLPPPPRSMPGTSAAALCHARFPSASPPPVSSRMWLLESDWLKCDCLIIMCFKIIFRFHKFRNVIIVAWNVIAWLLCASKLLFSFISLGMWLLLLGMWLLGCLVIE